MAKCRSAALALAQTMQAIQSSRNEIVRPASQAIGPSGPGEHLENRITVRALPTSRPRHARSKDRAFRMFAVASLREDLNRGHSSAPSAATEAPLSAMISYCDPAAALIA